MCDPKKQTFWYKRSSDLRLLMKHLSWNTPQLLKTSLIFLPNPYHLQNSIPWEKVFFPNVQLGINNQFVMTSNWERCIINPVLFVFYSIWYHLIALFLWLTIAPSFPSSLLFCCIFPLYYFPFSCFSWCLFCHVSIWFCPCFPQLKHWFNAPFISVTPLSQLCFLYSHILSLV